MFYIVLVYAYRSNAFPRSKLYHVYGRVSLWHYSCYFAENFRTIVMKRHNAITMITQGINFVGSMKVQLRVLAFCIGKLRVKWLKTGAFLQHIPVPLRKCPPKCIYEKISIFPAANVIGIVIMITDI